MELKIDKKEVKKRNNNNNHEARLGPGLRANRHLDPKSKCWSTLNSQCKVTIRTCPFDNCDESFMNWSVFNRISNQTRATYMSFS